MQCGALFKNSGLACAIGLIAGVCGLTPTANAADLQPHRAVYDLRLANVNESSEIADVRGRMVYEMTGNACLGYGTTVRFLLEMVSGDGDGQVTDLQISTFEPASQGSLRFSSKTFINAHLVEEVRGAASQSAHSTQVTLKAPEQMEMELEGAIHFPTEHLSALIDAARAGERFLSAYVYDGSEDGTTVFQTSTVMTPFRHIVQTVSHESIRKPARLWQVSSAYFDMHLDGASGEHMPDYEMSYLLDAKGITYELVLDYGSFSVAGDLVDLELLPKEKCQ
ncbi:EipB family protein [Pseudovibrio exalbescens]|uniref:EipB family protein n=1 Tax=Pseudovibrio exalbescens TaxID=197461 RepID=UPI000C9C6BDC|nr:DUF1849 family protein [Pseudovibrio exalbescens]